MFLQSVSYAVHKGKFAAAQRTRRKSTGIIKLVTVPLMHGTQGQTGQNMTKEEIKANVSIIDVLGRYGLTPNKHGFLCCPFHGERTPSLKIYTNTNTFHCFGIGCGASGDQFKFVMLMEHVSFKEAFEILGGTYDHKPMTDSAALRIMRAKRTRAQNIARHNRLNGEYISVCKKLRYYREKLDSEPMYSTEYEEALKQIPCLECILDELDKELEKTKCLT